MTPNKKSTFFDLALWIIISALLIASLMPQRASAQSAQETWIEPLNLSHSGAATNPSIIIDSDGAVHAVWQDEFANFVYARFEDGQWSEPQRTSLHYLFGSPSTQAQVRSSEESVFTSTNPLFIAGPGQFIFAVWITQQGGLYTSRVPNGSFNDVEEWYGAQFLASSVTTFAAAVDADGALHVAYLRTDSDPSTPAGIYYRHSERNGVTWSAAELLYESPYFRALDIAQTNISLATAGTIDTPLVYVVWDNRPRKQVFLVESIDGGVSWEPSIQVAGPVPDSGLDGPYNIRVGAKENNIVLVWQSGQPGGICTQYYQSSTDAGSTWSGASLMFDNLPGCALRNEFVTAPADNSGGELLLLTNSGGQIYLSAWNGVQWSAPQAQSILSSFEDPEIYTQVEYDCQKAASFGEQIYIVGCDRGGGGDIWVSSRILGSTTPWFSPPVWTQPALVTSDSLKIESVEMVATKDNLIHAFFSQRKDTSIYYTRWDGTAWSRIAQVLKVPNGEAGQPAVAAGQGDELFLIARSSTGSLYMSRAKSNEAVTPSNWSIPVRLPIAQDGRIGAADIALDEGGTVTIAYSIPVNDERGVYLIQSRDRGETWSKAIQVFDGAAADFDVVGSPSLYLSANGQIHILWKQESIPADGVSQPISLFIASSGDGGNSFGIAKRVVDAPVAWQMMATDSRGNLHQLWQRFDTTRTLWDQASFDDGHSWQKPEQFPAEGGIAAVTSDSAGRLHLVDVSRGTTNYWLWDEGRWQAEPPTHWTVPSQNNGPVDMLASSINNSGNMVVIFVEPTNSENSTEMHILYVTRSFSVPPITNSVHATPTQSALTPTITYATTPAESLLTPSTAVEIAVTSPQKVAEKIETNNPASLLTGVLLPLVLLLIAVVILVYLRSVWGKAR